MQRKIQIKLQSTLFLRTPRYYGHSLLRTKFIFPSIEVRLKMTPGITDSRYSGHKNDVPKVSAIRRADDSLKNLVTKTVLNKKETVVLFRLATDKTNIKIYW